MFLVGYISSFAIAVALSMFYLSYTVQYVAESFKKKDRPEVFVSNEAFRATFSSFHPTESSTGQLSLVCYRQLSTPCVKLVAVQIQQQVCCNSLGQQLLFPSRELPQPAWCHSLFTELYSDEYAFYFRSRPPPFVLS